MKLRNGETVPWLTLDDGGRRTLRIGEGGSGFVVRENGFILTNKHVVAGWMTNFDCGPSGPCRAATTRAG